jgi:hypothetical protein
VEYVCFNGSGSGGNGAGAIAAADGSCPSSQFPYSGEIEVGWAFICVYVNNGESGSPNPNTPSYLARLGSFTVSGEVGTFTGAYCPRAQSSISTAP